MRNSGRNLLMWLALAAIGCFALVQSLKLGQLADASWPIFLLGIAGAIIVPIASVLALWSLALLAGHSKLRRGQRLLARWHVSDAEWRRFLKFEALRSASHDGLGNDVDPAKEDSSRGIDVLFGETGVAVGKYYQVLRRGGIPGLHALYWLPEPADPQCLEFHVIYPRRYGVGTRLCVRVPIAGSAHGEARRVYDHFSPFLVPRPALALRNPGRTFRIATAIIIVSILSTAWALSAGAGSGDSIAMLAALIVSPIVGLAALVIALATWMMTRRGS